ncbi:MAG: hypothetical protein DRJ66_04830 [Thermoprotei archaeon]|nr:MAG: hypothetical protein DRJ66_04830 [Thermoprotei archaeon]
MAKGDVIKLKAHHFKDEVTGTEVIRLTDNIGDTIHPYFTQPLFSSDGETILVVSNRTGWWQLYRLDIPDAEMQQLTEDADIKPQCPCLDGKKMIAYYWDGRYLKSVDLETLEVDMIYVTPQGFKPGILSLSSDGRYLAFAYTEKVSLSTLKGRAYSGFLEHMFLRPRSVVMVIDLKRGEAIPAWGENAWISHVNICPTNPDIVLFCHEGPWHLVQRMWVVRVSTHEVWPLVKQRRYVERVGHEFFMPNGTVVAQYGRRSTPSSNDWVYYDLFVKPDGSGLRMYKYPWLPPAHIKTNSKGDKAVGDRCYPNPSFKEGHAYIGLVEYLKDGKVNLKPLCRHDTSWNTQETHPHPIFTPDDKNVIFVSDREGNCNVYMVPVD